MRPLESAAERELGARVQAGKPRAGVVYLVGAGPGDPELITVRGLRCLRAADVVVYDRLVSPELLDEAPPAAERIYAGKAPGRRALEQNAINGLLVKRARSGSVVVRLKGGDPFVFGRGCEEALACAAAGVEWEVVPGVTSAVGVPARAGIPLTHRGLAGSFAVLAGQRAGAAEEPLDWRGLAAVDTLVVLMGVRYLARVTAALLEHGKHPATPAAIIERGTEAGERVLTGTLRDLAARAELADVRSPATIVIGPVVALRDELRELARAASRANGSDEAHSVTRAAGW